jgi:hypothetical protein
MGILSRIMAVVLPHRLLRNKNSTTASSTGSGKKIKVEPQQPSAFQIGNNSSQQAHPYRFRIGNKNRTTMATSKVPDKKQE